jgi:hypothetical protein
MPLAWGTRAEVVQRSELGGKQKRCQDFNLELLYRSQQITERVIGSGGGAPRGCIDVRVEMQRGETPGCANSGKPDLGHAKRIHSHVCT